MHLKDSKTHLKLLSKINYILLLCAAIAILSCSREKDKIPETITPAPEQDVFSFGFRLNDFEVVRDTVRSGDTFTDIFLSKGLINKNSTNIIKITKASV